MIAAAVYIFAGILAGVVINHQGGTMLSRIIGRSRRAKAVRLAGMLMLVAGVAVAALLLSNQKGTGQGKFRQLQNITVTAGVAPDSAPYPFAGSVGDAGVKLSNPNNVPLKVVHVEEDTNAMFGSYDDIGCPSSSPSSAFNQAMRVASVDYPAASAPSVPAGASNVQVVLPNVLHVDADVSTACANAEYTAPLSLTLQAGS